MMPPPVVEQHEGILVVRDDLILGGTKARVVASLFHDGADEYVYASPAQGYAQFAIAVAARAAGKRATIFVADRAEPHRLTRLAQAAGATIQAVSPGYLTVVRARARAYVDVRPRVALLPFGLDHEAVIAGLATVARSTGLEPDEVWCVAGSGLLTRALQRAWPTAEHHAVRVGAPPKVGTAALWTAPEAFARPAKIPPPFPSAREYDAKAWQFVRNRAGRGRRVVFWNVGA